MMLYDRIQYDTIKWPIYITQWQVVLYVFSRATCWVKPSNSAIKMVECPSFPRLYITVVKSTIAMAHSLCQLPMNDCPHSETHKWAHIYWSRFQVCRPSISLLRFRLWALIHIKNQLSAAKTKAALYASTIHTVFKVMLNSSNWCVSQVIIVLS